MKEEKACGNAVVFSLIVPVSSSPKSRKVSHQQPYHKRMWSGCFRQQLCGGWGKVSIHLLFEPSEGSNWDKGHGRGWPTLPHAIIPSQITLQKVWIGATQDRREDGLLFLLPPSQTLVQINPLHSWSCKKNCLSFICFSLPRSHCRCYSF